MNHRPEPVSGAVRHGPGRLAVVRRALGIDCVPPRRGPHCDVAHPSAAIPTVPTAQPVWDFVAFVDAAMLVRDDDVALRLAAPEDGGYGIATVPGLPGCASDADDRDRIAANVADAIDTWIAAARRMGRTAPPPANVSEKRA
jgi:predicted RNase H-like HicB family nuclease